MASPANVSTVVPMEYSTSCWTRDSSVRSRAGGRGRIAGAEIEIAGRDPIADPTAVATSVRHSPSLGLFPLKIRAARDPGRGRVTELESIARSGWWDWSMDFIASDSSLPTVRGRRQIDGFEAAALVGGGDVE